MTTETIYYIVATLAALSVSGLGLRHFVRRFKYRGEVKKIRRVENRARWDAEEAECARQDENYARNKEEAALAELREMFPGPWLNLYNASADVPSASFIHKWLHARPPSDMPKITPKAMQKLIKCGKKYWSTEVREAVANHLSEYLEVGQEQLELRDKIRKLAEDKELRGLLSPVWYEYYSQVAGYVHPYELFMEHSSSKLARLEYPKAMDHSLTAEQANAVAKAFSRNETELQVIGARLVKFVQIKESTLKERVAAQRDRDTAQDEITKLAERVSCM